MISITLPYKLISEANKSEHWTVKRKRHKKERSYISLSLRNVKTHLPCHVQLVRIAPRALDEDNLLAAFKNIRDVISDILIPGLAKGRADGDPRLKFSYKQEKGKPHEYAIKISISTIIEDENKIEIKL